MDSDQFAAEQIARQPWSTVQVAGHAYAVVRLDGRRFSKLTDHPLINKPFDETVRAAMCQATTAIMDDFKPVLAYTQSDEITVVIPPGWEMFNRRIEKILSVSAGLVSSAFSSAMAPRFSGVFDSRIALCDGIEQVVDNLSWRYSDARTNAVSSAVYWHMRAAGDNRRAASKAMHGMTYDKRRLYMHEHSIELDRWQWFGELASWETAELIIGNERGAEVFEDRTVLEISPAAESGEQFRADVQSSLERWGL